MNQENRYAPPTAQVDDLVEPKGLHTFSFVALAAVGLQLLFVVLSSPAFFEFVRVGVYSLLHFLLFVVSTCLLVAGGVLLLKKSHSATVCLTISAAFGLLSLLQSKPLVSITGAFVTVLVTFASTRQFKSKPLLVRKEGYL